MLRCVQVLRRLCAQQGGRGVLQRRRRDLEQSPRSSRSDGFSKPIARWQPSFVLEFKQSTFAI